MDEKFRGSDQPMTRGMDAALLDLYLNPPTGSYYHPRLWTLHRRKFIDNIVIRWHPKIEIVTIVTVLGVTYLQTQKLIP